MAHDKNVQHIYTKIKEIREGKGRGENGMEMECNTMYCKHTTTTNDKIK